MTKKLVFNARPVSVFPYHVSLDTAVYRRKKPLRKLLAPLLVALNHLIWKNLAEKASPDWNAELSKGKGSL